MLLSIVLIISVVATELRTKVDASSARVGFQTSDRRRTSMDVIFSCLSTMLICTISAIHFDLPDDTSDELDFWEIRSKPILAAMVMKVFYWSLALLAPELFVGNACAEYCDALEDYAFMEKHCPGWTLKLSVFARMKGFTLEDGDGIESGRELFRRGAKLDVQTCRRLQDDIADKSKADILTKSIAIIQITRFLLEIIARAAYSLPISPLEYFTCAQVFCALLMYIFWIDKPHGVQQKIRLEKGESRVTGKENLDWNGALMIVDDNGIG